MAIFNSKLLVITRGYPGHRWVSCRSCSVCFALGNSSAPFAWCTWPTCGLTGKKCFHVDRGNIRSFVSLKHMGVIMFFSVNLLLFFIMIQWLVVGFKHFLWLSKYRKCHHPNWRSPSFFRGVGRYTTNQIGSSNVGLSNTHHISIYVHSRLFIIPY